jgi:hypothetical protein
MTEYPRLSWPLADRNARDPHPVRLRVPGVITPAQSGGPKAGNLHSIPCKFNRKWVGTRCNREAKGPGGPPGPPDLAPRARTAAPRRRR